MQSTKKANSVVTSRIIDDTHIGYTVIGYAEQVLDLNLVHENNRKHAEFHGWGQRVPDKAAIPTNRKDGSVISAAERLKMKHDGIVGVIAHYHSGSADWSMKSSGGTRAAATDHADTIAAIMVLHAMEWSAVQAMITATATRLDKSRQLVLDSFAALPKYAQQIMELRALRTADVDESELLADLPIITE